MCTLLTWVYINIKHGVAWNNKQEFVFLILMMLDKDLTSSLTEYSEKLVHHPIELKQKSTDSFKNQN